MSSERRIIRDLRELTDIEMKVLLKKAVIKAKGTNSHPPLDLSAIAARAEQMPDGQSKLDLMALLAENGKPDLEAIRIRADDTLDPKSQEKADIYMMIHHRRQSQ